MLTRKDIIDFCMTLGGVYEDYPFDDPNWTLMAMSRIKRRSRLFFITAASCM